MPTFIPQTLRPLERRLLRWRDRGVPVEVLAPKFKRSPEHLSRVIAYADMKREGVGSDVNE